MTSGETTEEGGLPAGGFSAWLDGMQRALRGERSADVPCAGCTACCTSSQFVHIEPDETETLSRIPPGLLFPAPRMLAGHVLLGYDEHGRCPMLAENGCSIYEHRPRACRTYDCRVFPAAGVKPDDEEGPLARRARRWRFELTTEVDRREQDAVQALAGLLRDHPKLRDGPRPARVAVLAVEAQAVVDRLTAAGCVAAAEEAAALVAAAPDEETLEAWVRRREAGEPLAWITGTTTFCGRPLHVEAGVYVPRPQSEELARRGAALLAASGTGRALDLCTGSGAVAAHLAAEAPGATVLGVDVDRRAVACARRNGVTTVLGDLGRALRPGSFDVVTAVAPYVPTSDLRLLPTDVRRHEPRLALDGGADGLAVVRRVVASAARLLRPGGWLLVELGGEQDQALRPTVAASRFESAAPWYDEDGDLRGLAARAAGGGRR